MKKKVMCKNCRKEITIRTCSNSCDDFSVSARKTLKITCKKCGKVCKYDDRDVYAVPNGLLNLLIFFIVLAVIGTMGYFWCHCYLGKTFYTYIVLPIIVAIPVMIYSTYLKSENTKIRNFNRLSKFK